MDWHLHKELRQIGAGMSWGTHICYQGRRPSIQTWETVALSGSGSWQPQHHARKTKSKERTTLTKNPSSMSKRNSNKLSEMKWWNGAKRSIQHAYLQGISADGEGSDVGEDRQGATDVKAGEPTGAGRNVERARAAAVVVGEPISRSSHSTMVKNRCVGAQMETSRSLCSRAPWGRGERANKRRPCQRAIRRWCGRSWGG